MYLLWTTGLFRRGRASRDVEHVAAAQPAAQRGDDDSTRAGEQPAGERRRPRDHTACPPQRESHAVAADPLVEITAVDDADAQCAPAPLPRDVGGAEREPSYHAAACPHDDHDSDPKRDRDRVSARPDGREQEQRRVVAGTHAPQRAGPQRDRDRGVAPDPEVGARDEEPTGRRRSRPHCGAALAAERQPCA